MLYIEIKVVLRLSLYIELVMFIYIEFFWIYKMILLLCLLLYIYLVLILYSFYLGLYKEKYLYVMLLYFGIRGKERYKIM